MQTERIAGYPTRTRTIAHPDGPISLSVVQNPDSLLDGEILTPHPPYWAELWPSALALAEHLASLSFRGAPVLELGCGMGLSSVCLARAGARVLAIDYDADALKFARHNVQRDGHEAAFARMDWGRLAVGCAFPYIVGADVLYERAGFPIVSKMLTRYLAHGGEAIIAEPGRELAREFFGRLGQYGLVAHKVIRTKLDRVSIYHLSKER